MCVLCVCEIRDVCDMLLCFIGQGGETLSHSVHIDFKYAWSHESRRDLRRCWRERGAVLFTEIKTVGRKRRMRETVMER